MKYLILIISIILFDVKIKCQFESNIFFIKNFCRPQERMYLDRKHVVQKCEWSLPYNVKNVLFKCCEQFMNRKYDGRPLLCYLTEYKAQIGPCMAYSFKQLVISKMYNYTNLNIIEFNYKNCYYQSLSQLMPETSTLSINRYRTRF